MTSPAKKQIVVISLIYLFLLEKQNRCFLLLLNNHVHLATNLSDFSMFKAIENKENVLNNSDRHFQKPTFHSRKQANQLEEQKTFKIEYLGVSRVDVL